MKNISTAPTASPPSGIPQNLKTFIETGTHSGPYTQAQSRALLDACRDVILSNRRPLPTPAAAPRTAAAAAPSPRAATTPAPAPSAGTTTAKEFEGKPLRMTKSEFDKMSPAGKSKFCTSGGKIV